MMIGYFLFYFFKEALVEGMFWMFSLAFHSTLSYFLLLAFFWVQFFSDGVIILSATSAQRNKAESDRERIQLYSNCTL